MKFSSLTSIVTELEAPNIELDWMIKRHPISAFDGTKFCRTLLFITGTCLTPFSHCSVTQLNSLQSPAEYLPSALYLLRAIAFMPTKTQCFV